MKKFWSGEETRRNGDELFRVKVVGSNPAGPTIQKGGIPYLSNELNGISTLITEKPN